MTALERAIKLADGVVALARKINQSPQKVSAWQKRAKGRVPAEYCPDIEHALNGQVTCEELRPDVSWWVVRGTAAAANDGTTQEAA